jgi:sugar phosphate isomerase/epimerase
MPYKVAVTSGLYYIARGEELATAVRKLGFGLTRGTSAVEIALDVPHEITQTEGEELRHIAKKQQMDILIHGSLTMPFEVPERGEWRDAHDHMQKSIRSTIYAGGKYVNFHACLNIWLELMTYAGRKLTMTFCDHEGRFIKEILYEVPTLREWFIKMRSHDYTHDILSRKEIQEAGAKATVEVGEVWTSEEIRRRLVALFKQKLGRVPASDEELEIFRIQNGEEYRKIRDEVSRQSSIEQGKIYDDSLREMIRQKLRKNQRWDTEELRASAVGVIDGYNIMAHYMMAIKDPIWIEMADLYKDDLKDYKLDYDNLESLDEAWHQAQQANDRRFKEFFYGTVGAKFLEGHTKRIFEWLDGFIEKDLKGRPELQEIARKMNITFETPDARDPTHAGLFVLWNQRQIYVAVKNIRKTLKTDKVWMLVDFEHMATQGVDPILDMEEIMKLIPDFGTLAAAVHANAPNPGHAHIPLELGDVRVYKLLWSLHKTGFNKDPSGKDKLAYVIYERGGGDDPFKQSIETLRLVLKYIEQDVHPDKLPPEFFGMKGHVAGSIVRQEAIVRDHAWEPLKDLLEMPEEEWGLLSSSAVKKGKAKEWEKAKNR